MPNQSTLCREDGDQLLLARQQAQQGVRWHADAILAVLAQQREQLRGLGVVQLGLFGSYSRGTAHPASDMDFLVTFDELSLHKLGQLIELLELLFGVTIDIGLADSLRAEFRSQVAAEIRYVAG